MLWGLARFITLISIIISLASPVLAFLMGESIISISRIYRYSDGASIGIYLNDESHDTTGARLVVRYRGFTSIDGDSIYEPIWLIFFGIPPVLWMFANLLNPPPQGQRQMFFWCVTCPFALAIMVIYLKHRPTLALLLAIFSFFAAFLIFIVPHQRASIAFRRMERGLCPRCAYDLRATPERGGPVLSRCPECGSPSEIEL